MFFFYLHLVDAEMYTHMTHRIDNKNKKKLRENCPPFWETGIELKVSRFVCNKLISHYYIWMTVDLPVLTVLT